MTMTMTMAVEMMTLKKSFVYHGDAEWIPIWRNYCKHNECEKKVIGQNGSTEFEIKKRDVENDILVLTLE